MDPYLLTGLLRAGCYAIVLLLAIRARRDPTAIVVERRQIWPLGALVGALGVAFQLLNTFDAALYVTDLVLTVLVGGITLGAVRVLRPKLQIAPSPSKPLDGRPQPRGGPPAC